jgi:hypothetical protein
MANSNRTTSTPRHATAAKATRAASARKARNPWFRDANGNRCRKVLESPNASAARMERNIQRDTCGLGHWRQPEEWDKEPFSHTVTMVTDWTGHMGGWQIYNSGVTVALINHPIEEPFVRGVPYVWCKQAHDRNGNSGVYPTAPLFGRFLSQTAHGPKMLAGKGKSAVVGAEYVYCFRAVGMVGRDADLYTRSEIPVPIPSEGERQKQPEEFDMLQHRIRALDQIICNMADIVDMTDELDDAKKIEDADLRYRMKAQRQARAFKALDTLIGEAVRQSTQIETQMADFLEVSPKLAKHLARWQSEA